MGKHSEEAAMRDMMEAIPGTFHMEPLKTI